MLRARSVPLTRESTPGEGPGERPDQPSPSLVLFR
jgi:hypothetical protein